MMKRIQLPIAIGLAAMTLTPTAVHAHGGGFISNVTGAVLTGSVVLILAVLAALSAHILRSSSISLGHSFYGVVAIITSALVIALLLLILMVGVDDPMVFGFGAVALVAGWWSIRLAIRVVRRNSARIEESESES